MTWFYEDKEFANPSEDHIGFVYCITELETGKKYIGKKLFWKTVKRKPRGAKRVKRVKVQSDWQSYFGSSKALQEAVEENGSNKYKREILRLCKSKGELTYYELKEQVERKVLFRDDYYNEFIGCKLHSRHVASIKDEES